VSRPGEGADEKKAEGLGGKGMPSGAPGGVIHDGLLHAGAEQDVGVAEEVLGPGTRRSGNGVEWATSGEGRSVGLAHQNGSRDERLCSNCSAPSPCPSASDTCKPEGVKAEPPLARGEARRWGGSAGPWRVQGVG